MSFLVPKPPTGRPHGSKKAKKCEKRPQLPTIFDKIRDLCRRPEPAITRLSEWMFVSNVFNDIHELCRRPDLLTPIEDPLDVEVEEEVDKETVVEEEKVYKKCRKKYYNESTDTTDSFDLIHKSKLFCTLIKVNKHNNKSVEDIGVIDKKCKTDNKNKCQPKPKKTRSVKSSAKTDTTARQPLKPILSIDCDIVSKINQYSKIYSKQKQLTKKSSNGDRSETNSTANTQSITNSIKGESDPLVDSCYESIPSPSTSVSTCMTSTYSMPATPMSSESCLSQSSQSSVDSVSTQLLLRQIRKKMNRKYETYQQYAEKSTQKKKSNAKSRERVTKPEIDFNEKVLEWKTNRLCSGRSTPVHNIEYLVTPPGSPKPMLNKDIPIISDDFNEMMDSLQNDNFVQNDDQFNSEFNSLLFDLYSDMNADIIPINAALTANPPIT